MATEWYYVGGWGRAVKEKAYCERNVIFRKNGHSPCNKEARKEKKSRISSYNNFIYLVSSNTDHKKIKHWMLFSNIKRKREDMKSDLDKFWAVKMHKILLNTILMISFEEGNIHIGVNPGTGPLKHQKFNFEIFTDY